jgi:hypothetical protein
LLATLSGVASASVGADSCKTEWFLWFSWQVCTPTGGNPGSGATAAPEIDPASAMAGLTLALGGLTVLRGRRSKSSV